jgi:hypothetical protein
MLRIYICPQCYNFRMVSRKPYAICFHCGSRLEKSELEYDDYIEMTEKERHTYRVNYRKRLELYRMKLDGLLQEEPVVR